MSNITGGTERQVEMAMKKDQNVAKLISLANVSPDYVN